MEAAADVVRDAFRRHEEGSALVRALCEREGAEAVVRTVAELVASRAPHHGEALLFLAEGVDLPDLARAIASSPELRRTLDAMLSGPNVRERQVAIGALGSLPVEGRAEMLATAAEAFALEGDLVSASELLALAPVPPAILALVTSGDWLRRWALLPWTNTSSDSPLAADIRKKLATDPHPLVAAEAAQHLAILEASEKRRATEKGWFFDVVSNHGPAVSFRRVAARFVASWPADKTTYTLDELRAFVTVVAARPPETESSS